MKKFSIILLALAFAVSFAGSALAFHSGDEGTSEGSLGISGNYTLDAESYSEGDIDKKWYDDDMEVVIKLNQGSVTGVIDLEISDDETFDGSDKSRGPDLVDNYWVEWQAMDNLKVKIGEYGVSFGAKVLIYADPTAHQIGLLYGLDAADLGLYLGKIEEGNTDDGALAGEDDYDAMTFTANIKSVDFFSKLNFIYMTVTGDDASSTAGDGASYMGLDTAFMAGPVAVSFEYGSVASDDDLVDGGNFMLAQVGLDDLVGVDLNVDYFSSSEEFTDSALGFGSGDFYPYMILTFRGGYGGNLNELTLIGLSGSYKLNDKATLIGKVLASGTFGPDDDDTGTEIDAHLKYAFDDNVTGTFTAATWSGGDYSDDSGTDLRARFSFKF